MKISNFIPIQSGQISNSKSGFTLIELLVVVMIIALLSSLITANFVGVRQRASDGKKKGDLYQIQSTLEIYRADQATYPNSLPTCGSPLTVGNTVYMQKVPCESPGVSYQYSSGGSIIYCLRTCLENNDDSQRDATNNPSITGCTLTACPDGKSSFTLRNP